jgi:TonB family protein
VSLTPCSRCARHVRTHERRCPFCGDGVPSAAARPVRLASLTRATVFYLGATAAACGSDPSASPPSAPLVVAQPPPSVTVAPAPASVVAVAPPSTVTSAAPPPITHAHHPHASDVLLGELSQVGLAPGVTEHEELPGQQGYGGPPFHDPALYGPSPDPVAPEPQIRGRVDVGAPTADDALDATALTHVLDTRRAYFRSCYERELRADPTLAGRLVVSFDVSTAGTIASCHVDTSTIASDAVAACVTHMFERLRIDPAPEGQAHVQVPITFSLAD